MNKYYIPKYLDVPFKIILWTWDEVIAFMAPFLTLVLLFDAVIIGTVSGVIMAVMLRKVKGEEGHYFIANLAYWYLPPISIYKVTPKSYIREYLG